VLLHVRHDLPVKDVILPQKVVDYRWFIETLKNLFRLVYDFLFEDFQAKFKNWVFGLDAR